MDFIKEILVDNIDEIKTKGTIFAVLYIVTIVPSWVSLIKLVKLLKQKKISSALTWGLILLLLLILPYAYLLFTIERLPWQFSVLILLVPSFGFFRIFNNKNKIQSKLWDSYAFFYDLLKLFIPYKELINTIRNEVLNQKKDGIILDVGCGTGNIIFLLAANQNYQIVGSDFSSSMLKIARKKIKKFNNVRLIRCDALKLNQIISKKVDLIILNNVLYALENQETVLKMLIGMLNQEGTIIISEPKKKSTITKLVKSHLLQINSLRKIRDSFILLLLAPFMFFFNYLISFLESNKSYNYFTKEKLEEILTASGAKNISHKDVYANQNDLVIANY